MPLTYLATPYTIYPGSRHEAYQLACAAAAICLKNGLEVFSPIVHGHALITDAGITLPTNHDWWMERDEPYMRACSDLLVVMADGWIQSKGIEFEIDAFRRQRKIIRYWPWPENISKIRLDPYAKTA